MTFEPSHSYLIALGSNMRSARYGAPRKVLATALELIAFTGVEVTSVSPVIRSRPVGPSQREYANAAAVLRCPLTPLALLGMLQGIEHLVGRTRRGQRWRARVLDLDIILWSGGVYTADELTIPHPEFRERDFVLGPAKRIAPDWRDPVTGLTVRQLASRNRA